MLIAELSPKARELVRLGRALNQPRVVDRERIQDALRARLGAAALPREPRGAHSGLRALARLATQPLAAARAKVICDTRFKADD
jgi:hypothetical protein